MKQLQDMFPRTPEGFHLRVEDTLMGLEEKEMKNAYIFSRRLITLVAAALILVFAATAVAVVQGNALRNQMNVSGGQELAAQVQDVHVRSDDDDFSFTIDEILWEGEDMFISYTVDVPDDGNVYLFSPARIELNGKEINQDYGIDAEFFSSMFAVGGEYGTHTTEIMQLKMEGDIPKQDEHDLSMECLFMRANRELVKIEAEAFNDLFTEPDDQGNENQMVKNADVLYYTETVPERSGAPAIYFHYYPEVRAVMGEPQMLSPEALEGTGIAEMVKTCAISIPVSHSTGNRSTFNDVAQRIFDMDGYSIEITELNLSHFNMEFEALIRKEGGVAAEWTENEPYGQWYFLCYADGSDLGVHNGWSMSGGEHYLTDSGEHVYRIEGNGQGIYPVENITEIYLAPYIDDENGEIAGHDMSRAIKLEPIYNPDLPESTPEPEPDPAETDDLSS